MGLDMYLKAKTFLGWNYDHRIAELKEKGIVLPDLSKFHVDSRKVSSIITLGILVWSYLHIHTDIPNNRSV